jgi:EcsC family protein
MSQVAPVFTEYEQHVIRELAAHRVQPNAVQRLLEGAGKPVAKLMSFGRKSQNRALRGLSDHIHGWIEEGLIKTFRAANKLTNTKDLAKRFAKRGIHVGDDFESLRYMPLSQLDAVADSIRWGGSLLLGAEGALLGSATTLAEGIPGAQLVIPSLILTDVTSSMTLLSRHTCRIATAYGYSSKKAENLPHLMAAMAPQTEASDEGYLALKTAVVTSIRESGQFMARSASMMLDRQLLEREAPQMIRLITYVADRLGIVITQKELGVLVPIAGAVLNSSINVAFQQVGHQTAKDYFRRTLLEDRYGEDLVSYAIQQEMAVLKASRQ